MRGIVLFTIFISFQSTIFSAVINVPGDYPTIQQAIDAAVNRDMVQVDPGTYVENIDFKGKEITVESTGGSGVTIIDGGQAGSVATIKSIGGMTISDMAGQRPAQSTDRKDTMTATHASHFDRILNCFTRALLLGAVLAVLSSQPGAAQVHYFPDGRPWNQRANAGPDAEVDGWYYNLGLTGIRAQLVEDAPKHLLVKYVFEGTPATGMVRAGDFIVGAGGRRFATDHRNGYGMDKFGPHGPILDFAEALEASQGEAGKGRLALTLLRDGRAEEVELNIGRRYGTYVKSFLKDCPKTQRILPELLAYLVEHQQDNGSWGIPTHNTFAPLALLASGKKEHLDAVRKNVKFHADTTKAEDSSSLINWRYMAAAIVMSEYYLATREQWVLEELQQVYDFLIYSQYMDLTQVNERVKETHPDALPKHRMDSHGGWGHNPGFEGYGPISMLTGQGALAFALMRHCGIEVDRKRHDAAYDFLVRGTGRNGYVWYKDQPGGADDWADMGRTGAAGIANLLCPYPEGKHRKRALAHAKVIGAHPESFPDTHGSPIMGMGYAALAANADEGCFRRLMDANKWWFVLSQCPDGSFYYQPNRDNAGYGADSRISATAVTAFIFSIPKRNLHLTGKPFER